MSTTEEKIAKMYEAQLKSQKEQLSTDYDQAVSDLDAQQQKNQQITDANLNRTAVEAQKAAVNNAELHNAYGLSSGTRAQARLAQENQLQADMTALRAAQQNADADTERQRSLLSREYAAAIRQAQAENDLAKAQALYENAKQEEAKLLAKQEAAAKLMADAGDYSRLGALYGLSEKEIAALAGDGGTEAPANKGGILNAVTDFIQNLRSSGNNADTPDNKEDKPWWENLLDNLRGTEQGTSLPSQKTWGNPFNKYKDGRTEAAKALIKEGMNATADLPIDESSIHALGFGSISEAELNRLVEAGLVEEYVENGYIKFRKKPYNPGINAAGAALRLP